MRGRPSRSPPRTIHSNRRRWRSDTSSVGLPAPTAAAGWARRSRSRCVTPSRWRYFTAWYASASTDRAAYQRADARDGATDPSRGSPRRTVRTGTGACRYARRGAARPAPHAGVSTSPRPAAIASANSAGSFFGAAPRSLTSTIVETVRTAVRRDAARDCVGVCERQRPLRRVVACRPRSRGRGSDGVVSSRRPTTCSRRPSWAPASSPGSAPTAEVGAS